MHTAPEFTNRATVTWAVRPPEDSYGPPPILDLEASGFGRGGYPIEVGYVLPDGQSFCSLIRPEPGWNAWDPEAERIHGIARETALRHGRSASEVAHRLNDALAGRTVYCDGWGHDYPWLSLLFDAAEAVPLFRLESLRVLLSDDEARLWDDTWAQVNAQAGLQRHRASADARLLQMTLVQVRQRARLAWEGSATP